ncbi:PPOX class F420-dependent oxidoreductase [Amycolatopsis sp. CA-230715]|uniref:PPOX class F420-dependent oxidoreductase n=1 Tax=Amycolatopsis sp. CA-230715 TaxID=2745196 RepID=UPI001C039F6E|nr:PPOX class F420-dependent oxidoreductase [Amycolatopsis sp. CA-230715]QWF78128.1 F420H(2)-dependent reductase [Amycolatopsis sp. CA-230715]
MSTREEALLDLVGTRTFATLATLRRDGTPQLSTVVYQWDGGVLHVPTTADRAKARNLRRDPRVVAHVAGENGLAYAVLDGMAELSPVSEAPGDETGREMLARFGSFDPQPVDEDRYFRRMVDEQRLIIRLNPTRVYGLAPGELPVPD